MNHTFDCNNTKILDYELNYFKRLISEVIYIKIQKNSINLNSDTVLLHDCYNSFLDRISNNLFFLIFVFVNNYWFDLADASSPSRCSFYYSRCDEVKAIFNTVSCFITESGVPIFSFWWIFCAFYYINVWFTHNLMIHSFLNVLD